ncbi:MAG: hypothetical protein WCH98_10790 [Verrucomicrobiota bacterium]
MNHEEIESLLHRARPPELPSGLKHRVLHAARQQAEPATTGPRIAWAALATCWAVIVLLRATTPDVPAGTQLFDREAFLARAAAMECIIATGRLPEESEDEPRSLRLHIESIYRLPKAAPGACLPNHSLQLLI